MTAAQPGGRTDLGSGLYERLSCWHCESFLHLSTAIVGAVRLRVASECSALSATFDAVTLRASQGSVIEFPF